MEAKRQAYRSQKKVQKATKKLREARDTVAALSNDEGVSLEHSRNVQIYSNWKQKFSNFENGPRR